MALLWKAAVVLALTADIGRVFQRGMVRGKKENLYASFFSKFRHFIELHIDTQYTRLIHKVRNLQHSA